MDTQTTVIWTLLFLIIPALLSLASRKNGLLNRLGPVVLNYIAGLILGNSGLLPEGIATLQDIFLSATIPLALPLIFFSLDLRQSKHLAGSAARSFIAAIIAVVTATVTAGLVFEPWFPGESWKIAGMLVGVYTGGTPNLASIGTALKVDQTTYIAIHTSDVVVGAVYLMIIITILPKIVGLFLHRDHPLAYAKDDTEETVRLPVYRMAWRVLPALGLAVLIVAAGGGASLLVGKDFQIAMAILVITTLALVASLFEKVRALPCSERFGFYLINVFSMVISSMANVKSLSEAAPMAIAFVSWVIFGSLLIHTLFSWLFRVERDVHIITTVSFVYSPPFVPMVCQALGNKSVMLTGILVGTLGWAIGNYLGVGVAYLLKWLL